MIPKFRAYDLTKNIWINIGRIVLRENGELWYLQGLDENFKDLDPPYFVEDLGKTWVLMQSTGLFDKNGKEIFEGHIVKDTDGYVGYIAFLKQEMGYVVVYKTYDKRLGHRYRLDDGHLEILGNIYEHPHLLGED